MDVTQEMERAAELVRNVREEIGKRVVGQTSMIDGILMGLLADGHVLIEGVPGLAKTLAVKTMAEVMDMDFKRIQFTPDLLPADLIGTMAYRYQTGEFVVRKGPVFSNIILADEINRAPAKVQSALLESMEERQVTIGDETYPLPRPYYVLATQNPIEHEGTYPLPEAQLDRFLMKLNVSYPEFSEEMEILLRMGEDASKPLSALLKPSDIVAMQSAVNQISVDRRLMEYIVSLVTASRSNDSSRYPFSRFIEYGASPRASLAVYRCAKINSFFGGRDYVLPEDVKSVFPNVLRHRIVLSYEAESEELMPDDIIDKILQAITVP